MTLGELVPTFGKFHCTVTAGIDGSAVYRGNVYPITIDGERIRITDGNMFLFSTLEEIKMYGTIE